MDGHCNFLLTENGKFKCEYCGLIVPRANIKSACKSLNPQNLIKAELTTAIERPTNGPNLVRRMINFAKAATQHELGGRKTVSDEVLKSRLSICTNCPSNLFKRIDDQTGICTHETCGCNIKDHQTYLNKIAWAEQKCPMSHWNAVDNSGEKK